MSSGASCAEATSWMRGRCHAPGVEASIELRAARLRDLWLHAVDELHAEAQRIRAADVDAAQVIALLHVLEERAHDAFAHYRDALLGR